MDEDLLCFCCCAGGPVRAAQRSRPSSAINSLFFSSRRPRPPRWRLLRLCSSYLLSTHCTSAPPTSPSCPSPNGDCGKESSRSPTTTPPSNVGTTPAPLLQSASVLRRQRRPGQRRFVLSSPRLTARAGMLRGLPHVASASAMGWSIPCDVPAAAEDRNPLGSCSCGSAPVCPSACMGWRRRGESQRSTSHVRNSRRLQSTQ